MFASKWRADLNVTLSALELLTGMAELDARFIGKCVHIIRQVVAEIHRHIFPFTVFVAVRFILPVMMC